MPIVRMPAAPVDFRRAHAALVRATKLADVVRIRDSAEAVRVACTKAKAGPGRDRQEQLLTFADYAARRWAVEDRMLTSASPWLPDTQLAEERRLANIRRREHGHLIRTAIRRREFRLALDVMTDGSSVGDLHFSFLEHAFPLMTERERALYLRDIWCRSKLRVRPPRALRLFRAAPSLRRTVPAAWPAIVTIYRGTWSDPSWPLPWRRATRKVRRGISWTTDRAVAIRFATGMPDDVGCLSTARVRRASILAYFTDEEHVAGYHEHECIIDPGSIGKITYERITAPDAQGEAGGSSN